MMFSTLSTHLATSCIPLRSSFLTRSCFPMNGSYGFHSYGTDRLHGFHNVPSCISGTRLYKSNGRFIYSYLAFSILIISLRQPGIRNAFIACAFSSRCRLPSLENSTPVITFYKFLIYICHSFISNLYLLGSLVASMHLVLLVFIFILRRLTS